MRVVGDGPPPPLTHATGGGLPLQKPVRWSALLGETASAAMISDHDWAAAPLDAWPQPPRTLVGPRILVKEPTFIVWEPDKTLLYDEPCTAVLGGRLPAALGQSILKGGSEIRRDLEPLVEPVLSRARPVHMDEITRITKRNGRPEVTHFACSYTPIRDDDGTVADFFCAGIETTVQVITERRQTFRLALEDRVRHLNGSYQIVAEASRLPGRHLKANRVGFDIIQPDGATVALEADYAARRPASRTRASLQRTWQRLTPQNRKPS